MRDPSDTPETAIPDLASPVASSPTPSPPIVSRLKRRADFLHAAKGKRWHGKALSLHAAPARQMSGDRAEPDLPAVARVGFTLTKKVGNSVVRNRARRRLREAVRLSDDLPARAGHDYVVIGRIDAVRVPFAALKREVARAVRDVHGARASGPRGPKPTAKTSDTKAPDTKTLDTKTSDTPKPRTIRP